MNRVFLMGRLSQEPDVRTTQDGKTVVRYNLAVERQYKKEGEPTADFFNCVTFGKLAEHAEKYYHKGIKIVIEGEIRLGSYTNREGRKIYTTDIIVTHQEFAESKGGGKGGTDQQTEAQEEPPAEDDFMNVPDGIEEELPFH